MAANALAFTLEATLKTPPDDNGKAGAARLVWNGAVGWTFNLAFVAAVIIVGRLAKREDAPPLQRAGPHSRKRPGGEEIFRRVWGAEYSVRAAGACGGWARAGAPARQLPKPLTL